MAEALSSTLPGRSGGLLPPLDDAMPDRLVPVLHDFLTYPAGAGDVEVVLADDELARLRPPVSRSGEPAGLAVADSDAGP